jgi:hypothetical protein
MRLGKKRVSRSSFYDCHISSSPLCIHVTCVVFPAGPLGGY